MSNVIRYDTEGLSSTLSSYEIYKLVDFYDPILRQPTVTVDLSSTEAKKNVDRIANSLAETLKRHDGLGLSANQCGRTERMFALNMGEQIWVLINPEIIEKSGDASALAEGCLSYPGLYLKLKRPDHVKVRFQVLNGEWLEQEFDGLSAVCVQHEIDHLDGKVFTEMVSPIKLDQAKKKVKQNLKRWKKFVEQQELLQQQMAQQQQQNKKQIIPTEEPKIQILGGDNQFSPKNEPSKFVYNQG
jgi:peptide deformylase